MILNRPVIVPVVLAVFVVLVTLPLAAQTASLVKDINTDGPGFGLDFRQLTPAGNQVFFLDDTGIGRSTTLWVSGGTAESTHIVQDFCPGDCGASLTIAGSFHNLALVSVYQGFPDPVLLWRSDGTRAGTFPLSSAVSLDSPVAFKGALYLRGCIDGPRCDLWKSDGTQAGTVKVKDIAPGDPRATILQMAAVGSRLFFTAFDGSGSESLWVSDGTAAGTSRLKTLGHGTPDLLTAAGNRLFFAFTNDQESALWTSDGTAAGTRALHTYTASFPAFWGEGLHLLGGKVYFVAEDAVVGKELWTSDGTAAGTRRVTGFGFDAAPIRQVRVAGNRVVFLAADGVHGLQVWSTAGSLDSTIALPNPACTECAFLTDSTQLVEVGGRIVFFADDGAHGGEPWVTDGTTAGTHLLADLCAGDCSSVNPFGGGPTATPQGAFFTAADPADTRELWRTDGTAAGTVRVTDVPAPGISFAGEAAAVAGKVYLRVSSVAGPALWVSEPRGRAHLVAVVGPRGPAADPRELTPYNGSLLFVASQGGFEHDSAGLWRSDGTEEGTVPLGVPLQPFTDARPTPAAGLVFFLQENQHQERTLWRTDGTAAGTIPLKFLVQGGLTAYQGKLFFPFQYYNDPNQSVWSSDGTAAGTVKVFDLPADVPPVSAMKGLGSDLYFATVGFTDEGAIWHSDGTLAGTQKIADLGDLFTDSYDPGFVRLGSKVLFLTSTVWATDGTPAGTAPLFPADSAQGQGASDLTVFQGAAYFVASAPTNTGLWRTDGTPGGTVLVKEIRIYNDREPAVHLVAGAGRLWFLADDGVHGEEVWTSDGTAAGTALLRDVNPGVNSSRPSALTVAGDRLFFTATDGVHGLELWESDGTAAGTRMVQDIAPFGASSTPLQMTSVGDRLFFSADDGPAGRELWSLPLSGPAGCQPSATALCLGGRYRVEARWRDFAGNAGNGHAAPLTPDTGTFWFFAPANVEAIVKVLDGQGVNGHVWVFYGALSNVEYTLTVTDTQTGLVRQYYNPSGQLASVGDTHAFGPLGANGAHPEPPPATAAPSPLPLIAERQEKAATSPCQPSAQRLCLNNGPSGGRFAVEVAWKDFQGHTGQGTAVSLSGDSSGTTGAFWFFNSANIELVVKALDGRPVNGHFWLFYGALSNVEYTVTVTDTQTGTVKTYKNPSGRFASVADTLAF